METIKVKPWSAGQGDHVLINAADFDPAVHQALDAAAPAADTTEAAGDAQAAPAAKTARKARAAAPAADTTEAAGDAQAAPAAKTARKARAAAPAADTTEG